MVTRNDEDGVLVPGFFLQPIEELADGIVGIAHPGLASATLGLDPRDALGEQIGLVVRGAHDQREDALTARDLLVELFERVVEQFFIGNAPDRGELRLRHVGAINHAPAIRSVVRVHVIEGAVAAVDEGRRIALLAHDCRQIEHGFRWHRCQRGGQGLHATHGSRAARIHMRETEALCGNAIDIRRPALAAQAADELGAHRLLKQEDHVQLAWFAQVRVVDLARQRISGRIRRGQPARV